MNTETGEIRLKSAFAKDDPIVPIRLEDLSNHRWKEVQKYGHTRVGPRERCPCGSGRRFKNCCSTQKSS